MDQHQTGNLRREQGSVELTVGPRRFRATVLAPSALALLARFEAGVAQAHYKVPEEVQQAHAQWRRDVVDGELQCCYGVPVAADAAQGHLPSCCSTIPVHDTRQGVWGCSYRPTPLNFTPSSCKYGTTCFDG